MIFTGVRTFCALCAIIFAFTSTADALEPPDNGKRTTSAPLTADDQIGIYSAVVRKVITKDDTYGGRLNPSVCYIKRAPENADGGSVHDARVPLSDEVQAGVTLALSDLKPKIVWVNGLKDVPHTGERARIADNGALVTLGPIESVTLDKVEVSGSIYVGDLAAGGRTYILEKVANGWRISGTTGSEWKS